MENPQQVKEKPKARKVWFIVVVVVPACCVIAALGVIIEAPLVRAASQGPAETPSVDATTTTLPADRGLSPTSTAAPSAGPAQGGRGDSLLKSDVWNSIVSFYASSRNCTDVSSTKIDVTQSPDSNGVWQEEWTVVACGETAVLKLKFTPSPQGGTDYHITQ